MTSQELISVALETRNKTNLDFKKLNILSDELPYEAELVTMTGFLCTFQDFKPAIDAAMTLSKKYILINDFINYHGVDSRHSFQHLSILNQTSRLFIQFGLRNNFILLNKFNCKYSITDYKMNSKLEESSNPLFNFHSKLDGKQLLLIEEG